MSLLDDAKILPYRRIHELRLGGLYSCILCGWAATRAELDQPDMTLVHAEDCLWLSMPKIAAALEAAERMVDGLGNGVRGGFVVPEPGVDWTCAVCHESTPWEPGSIPDTFNHDPGCAGQALIAAMRGDA